MTAPRAALFDMDRTLLRVETASLYFKFQRKIGEATRLDAIKLAYWLAQYKMGLFDMERVLQKALAGIRGMPEIVLAARCDDWFRQYVERHIADDGREAVRRHREAGDVCAIVTAASFYGSRPLASILEIDHVLASELEVDDAGCFTGRPAGPFCIGRGKLTRVQALSERLGFRLEDAVFYTDSIQDLPLLEKVGEPVCVNPDPRLLRVARKRGYRVERWF